ncbi:MAG: hypothetical protein QM669_13065 [Siphonobacter sp.]
MSTLVRIGIVAWLGSFLLSIPAVAQKPTVPSDTIQITSAQRDSIRFTNLRERMKKHTWSSSLYDLLFRYPYNTDVQKKEVSKIEENPFRVYAGNVIRNIYIKRLDVFGPSIYDTTRVASNWFERLGNSLHRDTREGVIRRSLLLFREGDEIEPDLLKDNERVLRQTPIFHDARIFIIPIQGYTHVVDVLVITQDLWTLIPDGGVGGALNFNLGIEQRNFLGLGHSFKTGFAYNKDALYQNLELYSRYVIPYLGRSLTSTQFMADYLRDQKQLGARIQKDFITPEIKIAGAFELSYHVDHKYVFVDDYTDSTKRATLKYGYQDVWLGRAFKLGFRDKEVNDRTRLIIAARTNGYRYIQRFNLPDGAENVYPNSRSYMASVGFSNRNYKRDVLIYGFGRTEDVPIGYLASLTWGKEKSDLGMRTYSALRLARGSYLRNKKAGYLYSITSVGGYLDNGQIQQGTFDLQTNYFSPLMTYGRSSMRHFLTARFTAGIHRLQYEYLTLNDEDGGIRGIRSNFLRGTRRLLVSWQTVFFAPFQIIGFRTAIFGFADIGFLSYAHTNLFSQSYRGYGIGFRFRNENLTFNTFQIRIGYYPGIPGIINPLRTEGSGESVLKFPDFQVQAPDKIGLFRTAR